MAVGETQHFEVWDPTTLYGPNDLIYVEKFCACGGLCRVRGPAREVLNFLSGFMKNHTGPGHGDVSKVEMARARSEAAERAFYDGQARGFIADTETFVPIDWDAKNIGLTNEEVYG